MVAALANTLRKEFAARAEGTVYERMRRQEFDDRQRRDRQQEIERREEENLESFVAMVSAAEFSAFRIELDAYDVATVEALQLNDVELTQARERLRDMFAEAHVLPDGRRVFKTEDGARVFDERGLELRAEEIDPHDIANGRPRWEAVKGAMDEAEALEQKRAEIIEYQQKLDDARERLDAGDMSRAEFDQLREGLKADMPNAVRAQLPETVLQSKAPSATARAELDLDIEDDMVPNMRVSAKAPAPATP